MHAIMQAAGAHTCYFWREEVWPRSILCVVRHAGMYGEASGPCTVTVAINNHDHACGYFYSLFRPLKKWIELFLDDLGL
jgi:hypothetical protein